VHGVKVKKGEYFYRIPDYRVDRDRTRPICDHKRRLERRLSEEFT
jgi:hypothetical protein